MVPRFVLDETMTAGVGTVRWIALEVLAGERYDHSADIYPLAMTMCEIDTHKLPFLDLKDDSGTGKLTDSAITGLPISGSIQCEMIESCPPKRRSLAEQCMAFDSSVRPLGSQVAHLLRRFLRSKGEGL